MSVCGEPKKSDGEPCRFPSAENCPHHPGSQLSHIQKRAAELLRCGEFTRQEVATKCGVSRRTIYNWVQRFDVLEDAVREGEEAQYDEVESAWIGRLKSGDHSGAEMIFYLKNKRPDRWRDRREIEHSGGTHDTVTHDIPRENRIAALRALAGRAPSLSRNGAGDPG